MKTISDGQTINNESFDLTLNKVELTYDVLPDDTGNFYTHYPADQGKVYINIDVDIKNNQKQDLRCDKILTVEANYNNGYTYNANSIVEDSKTGFTYSNITSITSLETKGMRYLINCPEEVEQSQNPLFLTFNLNGEKYKYVIR
ncbi:lipoprotein [Clostridium sp. CTA-5]